MSEFYKHEIAKWNVATDDLTLEQEAAYHRVVSMIRLYERPIKHNLRVLSGMWRCNERKAKRILSELIKADKLRIEGGLIVDEKAVNDASILRQSRVDKQLAGRAGGIESGKSRRKLLKSKEPDEAPASTREEKRREEKNIGGGGDAREPVSTDLTEREILLSAMGADPISGMTGPTGKMIGRMSDMETFRRWRDDLGLTMEDILGVIAEVMASKRDGPPSTFTYFNTPMQRRAGEKTRPALTPIEGGNDDPNRQNRTARSTAGRAHDNLIAGFARAVSDQP